MPLIDFTNKGLYCSAGDFYIDPWKPVNKAIISHGHSDHARWGSSSYLCHTHTVPILKLRLGEGNYQGMEWGEHISINGVDVSLYPAGHIIGSSQVRIEYNGEIWVFSGDFKLEDDGLSGAFEPVKCNVFITESTFGLPIYKWKKQSIIYEDIRNWVLANQQADKASVIIAYSLGKAQRVIEAVSAVTEDIYVHGAVWNVQQTLKAAGHQLQAVKKVEADIPKTAYRKAVIVAPSGAESSPWIKRFTPYSLAICSGWMQVRGNARRKNADRGFVLSDHADWEGLLQAVKETGAEKVFVTHGFQSAFSKYLDENGIPAAEVKTAYGDDEEAEKETEEPV
ncbi:MAG TPA: ligase-associated DNA damage response exonuclease [Chitinophagaceae bacterium]|nr:ligase-associated DNA damage response exonuclease [Chitinophagaceae bacterium]